MGVVSTIDISPQHKKELLALLNHFLPNTTAWAYGSRVTWNNRYSSDLDVVVFAGAKQKGQVEYLREALEESSLPFRVDLFVWDSVPDPFKPNIEAAYYVLQEKTEVLLPDDWITTELANVVAEKNGVQTGPFGSQLHRKDYVEQGTPILTVEHLGENRILHKNLPHVSDEDKKRLSKYSLKVGDIVFSRVGSVDRRSLVREKEDGWLFSGRCLRVRVCKEKIDPLFVSYYLGDPRVKNYIRSIAVGATMPSINTKILADLLITYPPDIQEQKAIAHVLGTIDDKIELNRKMNQTLEEIAKAIFKSWFVDFDPVRAKAEGRPTGLPPEISDLFPDKLVASEIGEIPKGWKIGVLSDVADITMGQSPPGDTYNDNADNLPFYQGSTDFGFRFPSLRKFCSAPTRTAKKDDVLLSVRAPVGDLNRAWNECCIGRGLASIKSIADSSSWIFYRCSFLKKEFDTFNSEGTVFGSINGKDLKSIPTIISPATIVGRFENIAQPIDQAIRLRSEEILVSAELRDTLLPKLISGEIKIK